CNIMLNSINLAQREDKQSSQWEKGQDRERVDGKMESMTLAIIVVNNNLTIASGEKEEGSIPCSRGIDDLYSELSALAAPKSSEKSNKMTIQIIFEDSRKVRLTDC